MDETIDRCLGLDRLEEHREIWRPPTLLAEYTWAIINAPDRPYDKWYSTPYTNEVRLFVQDPSLNVPTDKMLEACRAMLSHKHPVWAAFCVNLWFDTKLALAGSSQTSVLLPMSFQSKSVRLQQRDLTPNHAMLIVGVDDDEKCGTRWRIHNSWGKRSKEALSEEATASGKHHGTDHDNMVVTDEWMRMHLLQIAVDVECVPRPEKPVDLKDVEILPYWDVLAPVARGTRESVLAERVPYDCAELIIHHGSACSIQKAARRRAMRHTSHEEWPKLRRELLKHMEPFDFDSLMRCEWCRSEWRTEPASWLYTAAAEPSELALILQDVNARPLSVFH